MVLCRNSRESGKIDADRGYIARYRFILQVNRRLLPYFGYGGRRLVRA
jgi:hypothetical protein